MRREREFQQLLFLDLPSLKVQSLKLLSGPQDAIKNNSFYGSELKMGKGDLTKGFSEADNVVSGTAGTYHGVPGTGWPWCMN